MEETKPVMNDLEKRGLKDEIREEVESQLLQRYKKQLKIYLGFLSAVIVIAGVQGYSWLGNTIEKQVETRVDAEIQKTRDLGTELTKAMIASLADMTTNVTQTEAKAQEIQIQLEQLQEKLLQEFAILDQQKIDLEQQKNEVAALIRTTRGEVSDLEARIERLEKEEQYIIPSSWKNLEVFKSTYKLGMDIKQQGDNSQSIVYLESALDQLSDFLSLNLQEKNIPIIIEVIEQQEHDLKSAVPDLFNMLAWLYLQRDSYPEKRRVLAKIAVEINKNANYLDTLADIYFADGNYDQAVTTIKEAIAIEDIVEYREKLEKYSQFITK